MTNAYDSTRGNVTDRQRRREWLLKTYAADMAIAIPARFKVELIISALKADQYRADGDTVLECCRCYRCGKLLTLETLTVDRIIPGCKGGTYRRNNIRPSCSNCANKQGGELRAEIRN
jgi:5-methylcytosine-specific restriction endonuclease McrA